MKTNPKFAIFPLVLLAGIVIWQFKLASDLKSELVTLRHENGSLLTSLRQARMEMGRVKIELSNQSLARGNDSDEIRLETELGNWLSRVHALKTALKERTDLAIPEINLLGEKDWLLVAFDARLDTESDVRKSLNALRTRAKDNLGLKLSAAVRTYSKQNGGMLPPDFSKLNELIVPPLSNDILQRYEFKSLGARAGNMTSKIILERSTVDLEYDTLLSVSGGGGHGISSFSVIDEIGRKARKQYMEANNGSAPTDPVSLVPFISDVGEQNLWIRHSGTRAGR